MTENILSKLVNFLPLGKGRPSNFLETSVSPSKNRSELLVPLKVMKINLAINLMFDRLVILHQDKLPEIQFYEKKS